MILSYERIIATSKAASIREYPPNAFALESAMSPQQYNLNAEQLETFCKKWKITRMAVFGSVARGEAKADSDIDILVDYAEEAQWGLFDHQHMEDELAALAGRRVDLVSRRGLMSSRNELRKQAILGSTELVYAA
jgi:predicted nucleotidyltransferase